eukprot:351749-Chlamydomonas_euryale.AAC.1
MVGVLLQLALRKKPCCRATCRSAARPRVLPSNTLFWVVIAASCGKVQQQQSMTPGLTPGQPTAFTVSSMPPRHLLWILHASIVRLLHGCCMSAQCCCCFRPSMPTSVAVALALPCQREGAPASTSTLHVV